ncbi:DEAD/DEAH box helicase [Telmatospirillum sp. J64-1]|uniref:DEAD/DEAH box helicase n=1 Tax=Telmatospirillum sp. J64-1 TaxID=2502183 RepID=UPI00115C7DDC|nr:DEAD/DEAH box helicase [Telmatospirillum sp. J64-1]
MDLMARMTIARHGVAQDEAGLSPMQAGLLTTERPVTLASAPTGAGKSYVYRRAVEMGRRVLFVVPTRRLAQNQATALREDLRKAGWPERDCIEKIAVWTGDSAAEMRESGQDVGAHRRGRFVSLRPGERGEIIFITPESLSRLLLDPTHAEGQGDIGPAALMTHFDHIVFDEFHLTQARGFGLIALCAGLATQGPWGRETADGPVRAKVSLLSATPIDILPVMTRLGIPMTARDVIGETIIPEGGRALHGDVTVDFVEAESPLDVLRGFRNEIDALPQGQCAVAIYDALKDLQRDVPELLSLAETLGLMENERFLIDSSIDGQRDAPWCGRGKSLEGRRLIAATSTIEVGVTLPGLTLLVMDPGFTPLSFMQRLGRVARGSLNGRVVVRLGRKTASERPWLQRLIDWVSARPGQVSIQELSAFLADLARIADRFHLPEEAGQVLETGEGGVDFFAAMPLRAAFAAGVYWVLLEDRLREQDMKDKAFQIGKAAPPTARCVRAWLDRIAGIKGGRAWRRTFEKQACILRDFSPTVTVIGAGGEKFKISAAWLTTHTSVLDHFPVSLDAAGNTVVVVPDVIEWGKLLRRDGDRRLYQRHALLPFPGDIKAPLDRAPFQQYAAAVERHMGRGRDDEGVRLAVQLVNATGIIPYDEDGLGSVGAATGIL